MVVIRRNGYKVKELRHVVNQLSVAQEHLLCCLWIVVPRLLNSVVVYLCFTDLLRCEILPAPDKRKGVKPVLLLIISCLEMSAF